MSWWVNDDAEPAVMEASPADAVPGDEIVWVTDESTGPVHHAVEVGLVRCDPDSGRVRVLARNGVEHEFAAGRVVLLLRELNGALDRSRASSPSDQPQPARHGIG